HQRHQSGSLLLLLDLGQSVIQREQLSSERDGAFNVDKFQHLSASAGSGAVIDPQGKNELDENALSSAAFQVLKNHIYTNDCVSKDPAVKILKCADDSTLVGLIANGDESAYRKETEQLVSWCSNNHLLLNTEKTVEMVVDFRRNPPPLPPSTSTTLQCPWWSHSSSWAPPSPET
ncbi:hypothetical protein NFI96_023580, partial [Prochilodus magdalenae]